VHFNASTDQLTLICYDPYEHRENIFNQIGLISITAIGEAIPDRPFKPFLASPVDLPIIAEIKKSPVADLVNRRKREEKDTKRPVDPDVAVRLQQIKQQMGSATGDELKQLRVTETWLAVLSEKLLRLVDLK
jgi:hypothetical protein